MPFAHYVERGLAWFVASGNEDAGSWQSAMQDLARDADCQPTMPMLLDLRRVESLPADGEPAIISNVVSRSGSRRIAILVRQPDAWDIGSQLKTLADYRVRLFGNLLGAVGWLMDTGTV